MKGYKTCLNTLAESATKSLVMNTVIWNADEIILLDFCKGIARGKMIGLVML